MSAGVVILALFVGMMFWKACQAVNEMARPMRREVNPFPGVPDKPTTFYDDVIFESPVTEAYTEREHAALAKIYCDCGSADPLRTGHTESCPMQLPTQILLDLEKEFHA